MRVPQRIGSRDEGKHEVLTMYGLQAPSFLCSPPLSVTRPSPVLESPGEPQPGELLITWYLKFGCSDSNYSLYSSLKNTQASLRTV